MNDNTMSGLDSGFVSRSRSAGQVPFLFGVAGRSSLPGSVLTQLLVDLGLSISAARALLARMRGAGQLTSDRRGRGVDYRLAGDLERGFQRIRAGAGRSADEWHGVFHALLYRVPEQQRSYRDMLRRAALLSGYGLLQHGVLIAPRDLSEAMAKVLAQCPAGARVVSAELRMATGDAAQAALQAWNLIALRRRYLTHIGTLRASLGSATMLDPSAPTLRRFAELSVTPLVDTLRDPGLPAELLPEQWPRAELLEAISEVNRHYGRPAVEYVRALLAEAT